LIEILDFPFRLNMTLQGLGLVQPFTLLPPIEIFRAISMTPMQFFTSPLAVAMLHGPFSHVLNRDIVKPRVVPIVDWMFRVFEEDPTRPLTPATSPPGLRGSVRQGRRAPQQVPVSGNPQDSVPQALQPEGIAIVAQPEIRHLHAPPTSLLDFGDTETVNLEEQRQLNSPATPPARNTEVPVAEPEGRPANSPVDGQTNQGEPFHQIRISGHENSDGALIEELNISFYDRLTEAHEGPNNIGLPERQERRRPTRRHDLPLSDTPQRIVEALITAHITSILLLPVDSWMLPKLAHWWLTTQGASGPASLWSHALVGVVAPSLFSKSYFLSITNKTSKLLLCIAIREVIIAGVWAAQTKAVVWLGNWKLGWSDPKNKRAELP
jgi:hypothetical protein